LHNCSYFSKLNWLLDPCWILSLGLHAFFTSLGVGMYKTKTPQAPSLIPFYVLKTKFWVLAPFSSAPNSCDQSAKSPNLGIWHPCILYDQWLIWTPTFRIPRPYCLYLESCGVPSLRTTGSTVMCPLLIDGEDLLLSSELPKSSYFNKSRPSSFEVTSLWTRGSGATWKNTRSGHMAQSEG
jgi:hypothetical protein